MALKLFIADDSALIRRRLSELLSDIAEVTLAGQAADAPTALRLILQLNPDVVILDLHMPGGSGLEVLRQLRQQGSKAIVIILTAFPFPRYTERVHEIGADFFFDKADGFEQISEIIKVLLPQTADTSPQDDGESEA